MPRAAGCDESSARIRCASARRSWAASAPTVLGSDHGSAGPRDCAKQQRGSEEVLLVLPRVEQLDARVVALVEGRCEQGKDAVAVGGLERPQRDSVVGGHLRARSVVVELEFTGEIAHPCPAM